MADDLDDLLGMNTTRESRTQNSGFGSASATTYGTALGFSLLPDEQVLLESDGKTLILTTHRVRYDSQRIGGGEIVSIMLDELASCAMIRRSKPILLVLAGAVLLFSLYLYIQSQQSFFSQSQQGFADFGFLVVAVLVVSYFVTRRQLLELASAGAAIRVNTTGMSIPAVRGFIDQTEAAKNTRYTLGKAHMA
jgi:hypothetical protein